MNVQLQTVKKCNRCVKLDRTTSVPKSVLRYQLDKVRSLELETSLSQYINVLIILPLMGHPQPHPYTHNTVDNKSTLLLIISPLLRFFSNQAESFRHRTPHQTQDTSEKQGLAFMVLLAYKLETTGIESQKSKLFICFKIFWHLFAQAAKMELNFKMKTQFLNNFRTKDIVSKLFFFCPRKEKFYTTNLFHTQQTLANQGTDLRFIFKASSTWLSTRPSRSRVINPLIRL